MTSLGNVWDANETWLVLMGGALFGAFPLAYGTILKALYGPINLMILGLILRAVAFEFRENAANKRSWNLMFGIGSHHPGRGPADHVQGAVRVGSAAAAFVRSRVSALLRGVAAVGRRPDRAAVPQPGAAAGGVAVRLYRASVHPRLSGAGSDGVFGGDSAVGHELSWPLRP